MEPHQHALQKNLEVIMITFLLLLSVSSHLSLNRSETCSLLSIPCLSSTVKASSTPTVPKGSSGCLTPAASPGLHSAALQPEGSFCCQTGCGSLEQTLHASSNSQDTVAVNIYPSTKLGLNTTKQPYKYVKHILVYTGQVSSCLLA